MRSSTARSSRRFLVAALAGALTLAACGDDDGDDGDAASTDAPAVSEAATDATEAASAASAAPSAPAATTAIAGGGAATVASVSTDPAGTEAADTEASGAATTGAASTASTAPSGSGAASGGGDTEAAVVVGAVLEPTSLDIVTKAGAALDQVLLDNVYETLLQATEDSTVVAGLTELPEISEDGLTYTFTVPEGVTFHSGDPLTAADIVSSLDAFRTDPGSGVEELASIASVEAADDTTVVVTLSERDNDLLYRLTRREGAVLQADATDLDNSANGTGPFTFTEWNQGSSITMTRNDDYWGDPATVAEVTFQYFTDPNAAINALTTGDADVLTGVNTDLVGQFEGDDDYVVNEGTTNGEFTLGMNNSRAPFDNPDVRRAIRQAIDKEGYLELLNGFGTIVGGPVPPTDPWFEDLTEVAPYDPDAARAALEAAGVEEGTPFTLTWPNFYPTTSAEYVASQLADVGLEIEIVPVEFSVWLEQVYGNADYDLTAVLHVEPRDIANYANPDYYWRYDNPEVQQLVADAKGAESEDEANELLTEAARLISEDSPVDWLILQADITVSTPNITGYPTNDTASRFDASTITVAD